MASVIAAYVLVVVLARVIWTIRESRKRLSQLSPTNSVPGGWIPLA